MTVLSIEEEFALKETVIDGHPCRDFADNYQCLSELYHCFADFTDNELVVYEDERLTYQETARLAAALAENLIRLHSISPGDRIALVLPNSPDWIIAFLAITSIGATPALINARSSDEELAHCISTTHCIFAFSDRNLPVDIPSIGHRESWGDLDQDRLLSQATRLGSDEALLMFTSGTTGKPKAAILTHRGLMSSLKTIAFSGAVIASQMAEKHGVDYETIVTMRPPPVTLLMFPLFHVSGCHATLLSALRQGGKLVLMRRWNAEGALQLMTSEKVTGFPGVPTMHWDILRLENFEDYDLSSLTSLSIAGQATTPVLLEAVREAFPNAVLGTGYGMTECNGTVTLTIGDSYVDNPRSVGKLVATAEGETRDDQGSALNTGEVGEIHVRSPALMAGYANADNSNVFDSEGWMATGDVGYFDEDENLYIVDRKTDMVISGGENIYCAEVEQAFDRHDAVDECAAYGESDERLGERLVIVVRTLAGVSKEELLEHCGSLIARYKIPREIYFTHDPLPRNASGKVVKPHLKETFSN